MCKRWDVSTKVCRNLRISIGHFTSNLILPWHLKELLFRRTPPKTLWCLVFFAIQSWYSRYKHRRLNYCLMGLYVGSPCFVDPSSFSGQCIVIRFCDLSLFLRNRQRNIATDTFEGIPSLLLDPSFEEDVPCKDSDDDTSLDSLLPTMFSSFLRILLPFYFSLFGLRASYHAACRSFLEGCLFGLPWGLCFQS